MPVDRVASRLTLPLLTSGAPDRCSPGSCERLARSPMDGSIDLPETLGITTPPFGGVKRSWRAEGSIGWCASQESNPRRARRGHADPALNPAPAKPVGRDPVEGWSGAWPCAAVKVLSCLTGITW